MLTCNQWEGQHFRGRGKNGFKGFCDTGQKGCPLRGAETFAMGPYVFLFLKEQKNKNTTLFLLEIISCSTCLIVHIRSNLLNLSFNAIYVGILYFPN